MRPCCAQRHAAWVGSRAGRAGARPTTSARPLHKLPNAHPSPQVSNQPAAGAASAPGVPGGASNVGMMLPARRNADAAKLGVTNGARGRERRATGVWGPAVATVGCLLAGLLLV
jgi:hypothetical protein